ncbi:hypothetical protein Riv7116_4888 [Rivularia sp. PCC 7116]|uniref:hypothetical protein n=1 Tax=Rivularia sp. PCC 7116 TaxID=373994 RepID=UPI00029F246A|nr:hypothetical protein [Rivularia sp. PCC 7116]AFY57298.1 hypothetical protein Riv7116_4888 [Rivularia sp. PCC 7116]
MKLLNKKISLLSGIGLSIIISGAIIISSQAQDISSNETKIKTIDWQNTRIPDWNQIAFSTMPSINTDGSFQAPPGVQEKLGYNPNRSWGKGQNVSEFMMLGDFQDSFELQKFSLADIFQITNSDSKDINLEEFGVMKLQTLGSLVSAIPGLKNTPIGEVKPVEYLLSQNLSSSIDGNQRIGNLLKKSPHLGKLSFSEVDLTSYNIDSIPGLSVTPIEEFSNWQGAYIDSVPGLESVPFSQFPNPINAIGGEVGIVDVAFGTDEQLRQRTISGSKKEGFAVPCKQDCAHVELSGSKSVKGKAWVSGKYQLVKGGRGMLGSVNGGKEPTGRHLFGDAFKVAVWDVSEVDGMMSQALFFRVCMRNNFVDLGCTPYFIGPVPFMSYQEKDAILLGLINGGGENSTSTPTGLKSSGFTFNNSPITSSSNSSSLLLPNKGSCNKRHISGTNIDALSTALSDIQDNYDSVGNYLCDGKGNCGRSLGAMQFMSYRPTVRKIIKSKSGGTKFLTRLDKGEEVTGEEMVQYFSPTEQQNLIASDTNQLLDKASRQTDPTTSKAFTSERLIERVGQMHFGGVNIPIDSEVRNANESDSVKGHGIAVVDGYRKAVEAMDCIDNK